MTGEQLRAIRRQLGDTVTQFARRLGYAGSDNTNSVLIREYERGKRTIPDRVADRARAALSGEVLPESKPSSGEVFVESKP